MHPPDQAQCQGRVWLSSPHSDTHKSPLLVGQLFREMQTSWPKFGLWRASGQQEGTPQEHGDLTLQMSELGWGCSGDLTLQMSEFGWGCSGRQPTLPQWAPVRQEDSSLDVAQGFLQQNQERASMGHGTEFWSWGALDYGLWSIFLGPIVAANLCPEELGSCCSHLLVMRGRGDLAS